MENQANQANGISAVVIADSVNPAGKRITTLELEYPRFIHAELMTHRQFSRNSSSSRAVPVQRMIEQVQQSPATPLHWGKNKAGMQASEQLDEQSKQQAKQVWKNAANAAVEHARLLSEQGLHKQVTNRLLEPFQTMKVLVTATEFNNFFALRLHEDAQPEIRELAVKMQEAMQASKPQALKYGMLHLPYVESKVDNKAQVFYSNGKEITAEQATQVSCSCCAQVSYRKLDTSLEKASEIFKKLVESKPVHASAMEHAAMCYDTEAKHEGWTHYDKYHNVWSGNFQGWVQYRQLIKENVVLG